MVLKQRSDINDMFVQALYMDDIPILKTIIEGMKYTRVNHFQMMLIAKAELGGFTPFEFACLQGNSTLVSMLIDTGKIDVNRIGQNGWTPLHVAAYSGNEKTVQVLVNSCANCFVRDENNTLALDLTKDKNIREIISDTMRRKNLEKFEAITSECYTLHGKKEGRFQQRSKSCFANISVIKMNELKTQISERQSSSRGQYDFLQNEMKRWKTCSDLSLQSLFNLTC